MLIAVFLCFLICWKIQKSLKPYMGYIRTWKKYNVQIVEIEQIKNGFQSGKQRYKCTSCNKKFHLKYTYKAYNEHANSFIISLLKEGCGIRSISRVLNISKKILFELPMPLNNKQSL